MFPHEQRQSPACVSTLPIGASVMVKTLCTMAGAAILMAGTSGLALAQYSSTTTYETTTYPSATYSAPAPAYSYQPGYAAPAYAPAPAYYAPGNPVSGAAAGAAAGAATGAATAGPVGAIVGGALGTAAGAVGGTANAVTGAPVYGTPPYPAPCSN